MLAGALLCSYASAQQLLNLDSLLRLLPAAPADTNKVELYIQIGQQYEGSAPETSAYYYRLAHQLSRQLNYTRGVLKFINNYTYVLNMNSKFDSSLALNQQAVTIARELNDSVYLLKALFNAGTSARLQSKARIAATYYLEAQRIADKVGDEYIVGRGHDLLQNLYEGLEEYERAKMHGRLSLQIARKYNDSLQMLSVLTNLGLNYRATRQYDSAELVYREALQIARRVGSSFGETALLLNMGDLYIMLGRWQQLMPWYRQALRLSEEMQNHENKAIALRGIAVATLAQGDAAGAKAYALQSLHLVDSLQLVAERRKTLTTLANISFALRQIPEAEQYAQQASALADSITSHRLRSDVAELETIYELQTKEERLRSQQASLRQQQRLNYALVGLVLLLVLSVGLLARTLWQRQYLQRQAMEALRQQQQLAAAAALMQGEEQERRRLARELHDGLGGLLSGIRFSLQHARGNVVLDADGAHALEHSIGMLDQSIGEMRRVAHHMMPESLLRFGLTKALTDFCADMQFASQVDIRCHLQQADELEQAAAISVYRVVQELVNNAIKHAAASRILVQVICHPQLVSLTVEDDGKGFDIKQVVEGIGLANIRSRVNYLKGRLEIDSKAGVGTAIYIEWPRSVLDS